MASIIKYTLKELKELIKDDKSCVHVENVVQNIALPPWGLTNLQQSITKILDCKIGKYDRELDGIIISYKNVKMLNDLGTIRNDTAEIYSDIQLDLYVFRPQVGTMLRGVINKKSVTHLGILVHRLFNVVIPKPTDKAWVGSQLAVGQTVVFEIIVVDLFGALPYIRGSLDESSLPPLHDEDDNSEEERLKVTHVNFDGIKPQVAFEAVTSKMGKEFKSKTSEGVSEVESNENSLKSKSAQSPTTTMQLEMEKQRNKLSREDSESDSISDVDDDIIINQASTIKKIMERERLITSIDKAKSLNKTNKLGVKISKTPSSNSLEMKPKKLQFTPPGDKTSPGQKTSSPMWQDMKKIAKNQLKSSPSVNNKSINNLNIVQTDKFKNSQSDVSGSSDSEIEISSCRTDKTSLNETASSPKRFNNSMHTLNIKRLSDSSDLAVRKLKHSSDDESDSSNGGVDKVTEDSSSKQSNIQKILNKRKSLIFSPANTFSPMGALVNSQNSKSKLKEKLSPNFSVPKHKLTLISDEPKSQDIKKSKKNTPREININEVAIKCELTSEEKQTSSELSAKKKRKSKTTENFNDILHTDPENSKKRASFTAEFTFDKYDKLDVNSENVPKYTPDTGKLKKQNKSDLSEKKQLILDILKKKNLTPESNEQKKKHRNISLDLGEITKHHKSPKECVSDIVESPVTENSIAYKMSESKCDVSLSSPYSLNGSIDLKTGKPKSKRKSKQSSPDTEYPEQISNMKKRKRSQEPMEDSDEDEPKTNKKRKTNKITSSPKFENSVDNSEISSTQCLSYMDQDPSLKKQIQLLIKKHLRNID